MDPSEVIKTAGLAQQEIIGAPDASSIFQTKKNSLYTVTVNLRPDQEELVKTIAGFPILIKGGNTVTNDHPVLVALRELVRQAHETSFHIANTSLKTLIVGSTFREYKKYNNNKHISYYYAGKDSKDIARFVLPVLNHLTKTLESKITKYDRNLILDKQNKNKEKILKRYHHVTALINDLNSLTPKIPSNIYTEIPNQNFAQLDFQDSIYNFTFPEIYELFEKTQCLSATGYAFLPLELIFPDMPKSSLYTIRHEGEMTYFNFRNGVCSGYAHKTESVVSLFKQQTYIGKNFSLVATIEGRIGPFIFFRISQSKSKEIVTRQIEIPDSQKFVRVLDIPGSVDLRTGKIYKPLKYFSVNLDEYLALHNYAFGIAPESVTIPNLVAFIRNRIDGASLVTKQLVSPWMLEHIDIYKLAFNVYMYFKVMKTKEDLIIEKINIGSTLEYLKFVGRRTLNAISFMFLPLKVLYNFFTKEFLVEDLVLYPDWTVFQVESVPEYKHKNFHLPLEFLPSEDKSKDLVCPFCARADPIKGEQRIICNHKPDSKHTFIMSQEDIDKMFMKLADDDKDPAGLKAVKTTAKENMPKAAFEHSVNIHYLRGPPGTGKSYLVTRMASKYDLVFLPFSKLISDYKNVELKHLEDIEDGVKEKTEFVDYITKTTHRAFSARGCAVIWLDEFTAMDYYMLACVAYLNGTNTIYLVGDDKQTRIQPTEGMYIGKMIDLEAVDTHTLIYNFRNAWDVVALMNRKYGYQMIPKSKVVKSILFNDDLDLNATDSPTMHYKDVTAQDFGVTNNTVRSNQGGTFETLNLVIAGIDDELLKNSALTIVALTRHKKVLTIKTDKSLLAKQFVAALNLDDDFYNNIEQYIPDLNSLITPQLTQRTQEEILALVNDFEPTELVDEILNNAIINFPNKMKETIYAMVNKSKFLKYANISGRCALCLSKIDKLCPVCTGLHKNFQQLIYEYSKLAMDVYKKIKHIDLDKNSNKLHIYHILLMTHEMAIYYVLNYGATFEEFLESCGMFSSKTIMYNNIKNMISQKHPLFTYFVKITSQIKNIRKNFSSQELAMYEIKIKNTATAVYKPESINIIYDEFSLIHRINSHKHFKQTFNDIYNDVQNEKIIQSENAIKNLTKYLIKTKSTEDQETETEKPITINEQDNGDKNDDDDDVKFVYPHQHDFCQCNDFIGSYLCDQENCPSEIPYRGSHKCFVVEPNTKYYPMPSGNICLLQAIAEILNITPKDVWDRLIKHIPEENVKAFSEQNHQMDITTLKYIALALNLTVIVTPEANWEGPLTFGTGGTTVYISWTYNDLYDCGHWFISESNKYTSSVATQYFNISSISPLAGSLFISTKSSDVVMKQIPSIEHALQGIKNEELFMQEFYHLLDGPVAPKTFVPIFDIKKLEPPKPHYVQGFKDAHNLIEYMIPKVTLNYNFQALNKYGVLAIEDNFSNGKFNPNQLLNPVNPRLHPIKQDRTFYTATSGYGLHYSAVDRFQELQCLQDRYFSKKSKAKFSYNAEKLANEIADLFVNEAFDGNFSAFDDDAAYLVLKEYADACRKKHYPSQIKGIVDNTRVRTVRFAMKEIFKPTKLKMELTKAGQGISAWSKDIQVMIGGIIRLVTRHVTSGLKPEYAFNNGMTEEELLQTINALFKKQNKWADTAVVDFDRYDATQNRFTQAIEQRILYKLGINQTIIDIYYSFRENYSLISQIAKGNGGTTKTSGEPGTLLFNTLLAMALTNWICRGVGPVTMLGQGDDVIKRQLNINKLLAKERLKLLNNYVKMKMKLDINIELEFCGFSVVRGALIPSLARKLKKITGHRFRDYKHFTEYQISLRDSLSLIKRMGLSKVIAENANMFSTSYDTAFWQYSTLQSFGHLDEKQFYSRFIKTTVSPVIPNPGKLLY